MTSRSAAQVRRRRVASRRTWRIWRICQTCQTCVIVLACALPGAAHAEPAAARTRAEALFTDGNAAIARNDAATAAMRYRAAWDLAPEARFALNLGIALAELGRTAGAAEAFAIYLADPTCDPAKRPVLEQRLRLWRPELGEIVLDVTPASAIVEIDGARPLRSAAGIGVPVAPGSHRVTARTEGLPPRELHLVVAPGGRAIAHIALAAPNTRDAVPEGTGPDGQQRSERSDRPTRSDRPERIDAGTDGAARTGPRPWMWIALGGGVAAAAVGGYFGVTAIDRWGKVDERCPDGTCTSAADLALAADARRAGTRSSIAFGVSGGALIAALLLWRFEPGRRSKLSSVWIAPHISGGVLCVGGPL